MRREPDSASHQELVERQEQDIDQRDGVEETSDARYGRTMFSVVSGKTVRVIDGLPEVVCT